MTKFVKGKSILQFQRPSRILHHIDYSYRQRRVIESILYHHPNAEVIVHTNYMLDSDFAPFIKAGYSVRTAQLSFETLAVGTPLEGAMSQARWKEWEIGKHWYTCFSDLYRLLILWKIGGVYIDTDMVVMKPFKDLDRAVGFQDPDRGVINCAIMVFRRPRSPYIWRCMAEVSAHYDGEHWGANGPMVLTRVWQHWANHTERDAAVRVLDQIAFYLFHHRDARHHCFNTSVPDHRRLAYAQALAARAPYAVHTSNKMTWTLGRELPAGSFCHYIFTRFCLFCNQEPPRPPSYPVVDVHGTRVELL